MSALLGVVVAPNLGGEHCRWSLLEPLSERHVGHGALRRDDVALELGYGVLGRQGERHDEGPHLVLDCEVSGQILARLGREAGEAVDLVLEGAEGLACLVLLNKAAQYGRVRCSKGDQKEEVEHGEEEEEEAC